MADEEDDLQQVSQNDAGENPPAEPATPNPYQKEVEEWKSRAARIEQIAAQAAAAAQSLSVQQQNAYQQPQRSAYVEPEEEPDFDPMDRKAVSKEIDRRATKIAQTLAAQYQQQFSNVYQQNDTRFAMLQRSQTYDELKRMGLEDLAPDVDAYIQEAQITPQYLSDPRAWETLAATVLGKRKLKEARENAGRAPLLGSAGGRSPSGVPQHLSTYRGAMFDDSDRGKLTKFGLDEEEAEMFLRGPVGVADFEAFNAKRAVKGGRK